MLKILRTKGISQTVKNLLGVDGNTAYTWGDVNSLLQRQQQTHQFQTDQRTVNRVLQKLVGNYKSYKTHKARLR